MHPSPDDIDIGALWRAIARSKVWLGLAVLLTGLATYLVLSTVTPMYRSVAQVLIKRDESAYVRPRGEQGQPLGQKVDDAEVASQVEVVHSPDLLSKVGRALQLAKHPDFNPALRSPGFVGGLLRLLKGEVPLSEDERVLSTFESNLAVYQLAKTHLIEISLVASDPRLAAKVTNAIAETYIEQSRQGELTQTEDAATWIGGQITAVKLEAEKAEAALEKFRAESGLLTGQNNVTLSTQQLSELNTQMTQVRATRAEAEARAKSIREMLAAGDVDASPEVLKSTIVQRLVEQKTGLEHQIAELSASLLPGHPRMRQLASALASVRMQLRAEALKVVRSTDNEAAIAKAREEALAKSIADLTALTSQSSQAQAQLRILEREAASKRETYDNLLNKLNDAASRKDRRAVPTFATLVSSARPSSVPDSPKKGSVTLLSMLGALLLGLAGIVTRELLLSGRGGPRRAAATSAARTEPAAAPARPAAAASVAPPAAIPKPGRPIALGSIAELADRLAARGRPGTGYRTIVVSEQPGTDGIEQALELARRLASAGRRVVLVDGSGAAPGLAGSLGLEAEPGLRSVAFGLASFEAALKQDPESTAHILPAGVGAATASPPSGEQLQLVLDALDASYEHVVLCGDRPSLIALFQASDGAFDTGAVLMGARAASGPGAVAADSFLGFNVPGLDRVAVSLGAASPVSARRLRVARIEARA